MRLCACLLLVAMLLASCSVLPDEQTGEQTTDAELVAETTEAETTPLDLLPTGKYDGTEVNVLIRSEFTYEFDVWEQTGDRVSDAVYKRNLKIEENLGVKLNYIDVPGSYSNRKQYITALSASVDTNDGEYDLCASAANYMFAVVGDGYLLDLIPNPSLDLSQPWWSQGYVENLTVGNSLYLATGSAALNMLDNLCVTYFNKDLVKNYSLENPYDLVRDDNWTIGKMMEMAENVVLDTTGDGAITVDDRLGLLTYGNMLNAQFISFGLSYCARDDQGYPQVADLDERIVTALDLVTDYVEDGRLLLYKSSGETLDIATQMNERFSYGTCLFMQQVLSSAESLRGMQCDFGIIPMPKLDETQERYYSCAMENLTVLGIPASAKDPELSGKVLESLAIIGYTDIVPNYFEIALKGVYARDVESAEMLDLILENTWFDFFYLNSPSLNSINHLFRKQLASGGSIASAYASQKTALEKSLTALLDKYRNLKEE